MTFILYLSDSVLVGAGLEKKERANLGDVLNRLDAKYIYICT